ncbi:hypothetical protein B0H66DRAFT_600831 [Apodospora peruviana]|uniref:Uncharacterized protein n=1 Tax=Apodospora peruviana TaxID=516989 RepID=A0AAE0MC31_9PEZI|nr:hypothetical protein B0H66DRAFT_600831 [Apodospora peruviana]
MKLPTTFFAATLLGSVVSGTPAPDNVVIPIDDSPASGCCPALVYQFNYDNKKAGGKGCDPPWGFLANNVKAIPGYCGEI